MLYTSTIVLLALSAGLASATEITDPYTGAPRPGTTLPGGWSYVGCYKDNVNDRALSADGYTDTTGMSEGSCMVYCQSKGYNFAGIEYGSECYCGLGLDSSSTKEDDSFCNIECPGAQGTGDACGGQEHLSVFTNGPPKASNKPEVNGFSYSGCYVDSVPNRILVGHKSDGPDMDVELCTSTCKTNGFALAGLEHGTECFCSNLLAAGAQLVSGSLLDTGCDMLCPGDGTEYCGGQDRVTLYTDKSASKPSSVAPSSSAPVSKNPSSVPVPSSKAPYPSSSAPAVPSKPSSSAAVPSSKLSSSTPAQPASSSKPYSQKPSSSQSASSAPVSSKKASSSAPSTFQTSTRTSASVSSKPHGPTSTPCATSSRAAAPSPSQPADNPWPGKPDGDDDDDDDDYDDDNSWDGKSDSPINKIFGIIGAILKIKMSILSSLFGNKW